MTTKQRVLLQFLFFSMVMTPFQVHEFRRKLVPNLSAFRPGHCLPMLLPTGLQRLTTAGDRQNTTLEPLWRWPKRDSHHKTASIEGIIPNICPPFGFFKPLVVSVFPYIRQRISFMHSDHPRLTRWSSGF
jgi:hypothetical protein